MKVFHLASVAVIVVGLGGSVLTGQSPIALDGLKAENAKARAAAFNRLSAAIKMTGGASILRERDVQDAILELLRTENRLIASRYLAAQSPSDELGEGYGEYYSDVLAIAKSLVPTLPKESQAVWLEELADSTYNPNSPFSDWLAGFGDNVVEPLLRQRNTGATVNNQLNAYTILTKLATTTAFQALRSQPGELPTLSLPNRQRVLQAVDDGLNHTNAMVAREVVWALRREPSAEAVTILRTFDKKSQIRSGYSSSRIGQGRTLSEEVHDAILKMESRIKAGR